MIAKASLVQREVARCSRDGGIARLPTSPGGFRTIPHRLRCPRTQGGQRGRAAKNGQASQTDAWPSRFYEHRRNGRELSLFSRQDICKQPVQNRFFPAGRPAVIPPPCPWFSAGLPSCRKPSLQNAGAGPGKFHWGSRPRCRSAGRPSRCPLP